MAHIPTLILIPRSTQVIDEAVEQLLASYEAGIEVEPYRAYLSQDEIEQMIDSYQTANLQELAQYMQDWNGSKGGFDERGIYSISTYNPLGIWDYWLIGGYWNGVLKGKNIMPSIELTLFLQDLNNFFPLALVEPNGVWHEGEHDSQWQQKVIDILKAYPDCLAVLCDLHV